MKLETFFRIYAKHPTQPAVVYFEDCATSEVEERKAAIEAQYPGHRISQKTLDTSYLVKKPTKYA